MATTGSDTQVGGASSLPRTRVISAGSPTRIPVVGRRRNYLINPAFQLRAMLLPSIVAIVSVTCLVFLHFLMMSPGPQSVAPGSSITLRSLMTSGWLGTSIIFSLVYASLFVFLGIIETHKAAGAVYKIKHYLHRVARGDLRSRITLRRRDHFKDVAEVFNSMTDALLEETRRDLDHIHVALDGIGHVRPSGDDESSQRLAKAWDHLVELKHRKQHAMS
jgi:methyl-accepting chemotaxis protein